MISEESPSRAEGLFSTVSNDAGYFVGSVPGLSTPQYAAATPILVVPLPPTSTLHIALPSDTLAGAGPPWPQAYLVGRVLRRIVTALALLTIFAMAVRPVPVRMWQRCTQSTCR